MKRTLLLNSDPADGGESTPSPAAAVPPAAAAVLNSDVNESDAGEVVQLRRKLSDEERARKLAETRASQLEDENRTLKSPPTPAAVEKKSFLDGATFFEGAD